MIYRDNYGRELHTGDIVEDTSKKVIGRIYHSRSNRIAIKAEKEFSWIKMNYLPLKKTFFYNASGKHNKLYWFLHRRHKLKNIVLLHRREKNCG